MVVLIRRGSEHLEGDSRLSGSRFNKERRDTRKRENSQPIKGDPFTATLSLVRMPFNPNPT